MNTILFASIFYSYFFRKKFAGSWSDETEMINWYNHLRLGFLVTVTLLIMLMVVMTVKS